ncbi:MAG: helix-turn-helix domain-containing protein [Myxococcaceae bacterium]
MSLNQIPNQLLDAVISLRAQMLWIRLAMTITPESSELWIRQATLAEQLRCSRRSIGRALQELIKAGLIMDLQKRHLSRYKIYQLNHLVQNYIQTSETSPLAPKKLSKRELEDIKTQQRVQALLQTLRTPVEEKELNSKAREMLGVWKNAWKEKFPKLDGQSNRPYLESCVQKFAGDIGNWQYGRIPNHIEFMESCLKTVVERYC